MVKKHMCTWEAMRKLHLRVMFGETICDVESEGQVRVCV